ncbi:MAG: alpha/beta hydrolase [Bacteroidia bacterium]
MRLLLFIGLLSYIMVMGTDKTIHATKISKGASPDLHYILREPIDTIPKAPVLILLHGYGSNESDLFPFANQIPDHWLVASVRAPFRLSGNQFKWYDAKLVNGKITLDFVDEESSRKQLLKFIDQLTKSYRTDKNKVVVAGFSQGANMALALALTEPEKILAVGCFSGRFIDEIKPLIKNKEALGSKQIFIAHGTEDRMLPLRYAEENQKTLEGLGMNVKLSTDKVGHTISAKQFDEFIAWMATL